MARSYRGNLSCNGPVCSIPIVVSVVHPPPPHPLPFISHLQKLYFVLYVFVQNRFQNTASLGSDRVLAVRVVLCSPGRAQQEYGSVNLIYLQVCSTANSTKYDPNALSLPVLRTIN